MTEAAVIVLLCCTVISGLSGVVLNGSLLILTLIRSELRVDYCWFLIGMSLMNIVYCFNLAVVQTAAILLDIDARSVTCQAAGFLLVMCCAGSVLTQPMLALNRYSTIFYHDKHATLFSRRNIFLMISLVCILSFLIAMSYVIFDDYAKFNSLCCFDMVNMDIMHLLIFFMIPVGVAYAVSIFCGFRITRFLKRHEAEVKKIHQIRSSRIRETKQLVKLIFLEIGIPVCLETPILMLTIVMRFVQVPDVLVSVACGLFIAHASTDPVVITLVLKPYRVAAKRAWNRIRGKNDLNSAEFFSRASSVGNASKVYKRSPVESGYNNDTDRTPVMDEEIQEIS